MTDIEKGTLYIVATPIGNLEDITLRALRILAQVDVVFCEDTRMTKRILERHEINARLKSLNARTEREKSAEVLEHLEQGDSVAYVSDAGTPSISDPGSGLVHMVREGGFPVRTIPGASALVSALSISGMPASGFVFLGFLPHKKGRQTLLKEISEMKRTVVLYESTHRIVKLLTELKDVAEHRKICIARELTKMHEEVLCGSSEELMTLLEADNIKQKGEFVVIIAPL